MNNVQFSELRKKMLHNYDVTANFGIDPIPVRFRASVGIKVLPILIPLIF